jgi:hypothetical protein
MNLKKLLISVIIVSPMVAMGATDGEIALGAFLLGTMVNRPIDVVVQPPQIMYAPAPHYIPAPPYPRSQYRQYPDSFFHGFCAPYYGRSYQECIIDARRNRLEAEYRSGVR